LQNSFFKKKWPINAIAFIHKMKNFNIYKVIAKCIKSNIPDLIDIKIGVIDFEEALWSVFQSVFHKTKLDFLFQSFETRS